MLTWANQVSVFYFNLGKYNSDLIKEHSTNSLVDLKNDKATKKENKSMFLTVISFKFLDMGNYVMPDLCYNT